MDDGIQLRCFGCGYALKGIDSARCPECGRNINPGEQIASYRENVPLAGRRRDFHLFPDKIVVKVRWLLRGEAETPIRLIWLNPADLQTLRQRHRLNLLAVIAFLVGATFSAILIAIRAEGGNSNTYAILFWTVFSLAGLIFSVLSVRKIEYVRFRDNSRSDVILLDIGRIGPDTAKMDDFVSALQRQITVCHETKIEPRATTSA